MKQIKLLLALFFSLLIFSCNRDPVQADPGTPNSTNSGSFEAGNDNRANVMDTLYPSQPNGMDTTGEQTGRMNNTGSSSNQLPVDSAKK
ncbi:MAG TPA: hypothetical protein VN722_10175 [Hanamia sp.]|nr:hypothetical protein [Hanamia sp.]